MWEESQGWGNKDDLDAPGFMTSQVEQTRMMVRASINHPSVVVSAFLNEFRSDTRTFFRGGGDIRTKPMGYNMAGLFDARRREKLAAATVRRHYAK